MGNTITAYKAFNEELQCREFQYEVGKSYKHDGDVKACKSGFHACTNPLDCLSYYDIASSRFCVVELSGEQDSEGHDSKIAAAEIHIKAELKLPEFIKRSVEYIMDIENSDDDVQVASGNYAQLAASGDTAQLAASGDYAKLAASGNYAKLAASGDYAKLAASGKKSVIASSSIESKAKGAQGTWISLAEFNDLGDCVGFATGCIGSNGLKADVWYIAKNGELVEV